MTIRKQVAEYIQGLSNETSLEHSKNLFEEGILTSLDVLDLISFIEGTFNLQIPVEEVSMESFGSIDGIVALIEKIKEA